MLQVPAVFPQSAIWFYNWTDEVFTYPWGGENYTFQPKQRMRFPMGIAYHFAKHLAEHTFNSAKEGRGIAYNLAQLQEAIEKGLIKEDAITGVSEEKMRIMAMNATPEMGKPEVKVGEPKAEPKKRGRKPKAAPAAEVKSDLDGFEGK